MATSLAPVPDLGPRRGRWLRWWIAARPRTLTMAVTPVVVGAALAAAERAALRPVVLVLTLACAVLIQVATNYLNDVTDFEQGNDRPDRVGPLRVTAAGLATPAEVRRAAWLAFGTALLLGLALVWVGGVGILLLGLGSITAGWAYSGSTHPISHGVLGEVFVLVFFGLVAVTGTHYLQAGHWSFDALAAGAAVGSIAAAVLLLNNYRDVAADTAAGRCTMAASLGPVRARRCYALLMLAPFALPLWFALRSPPSPWPLLALLALPLALGAIAGMRRAQGPALNPVLARTAVTQLTFGLLFSLGLVL